MPHSDSYDARTPQVAVLLYARKEDEHTKVTLLAARQRVQNAEVALKVARADSAVVPWSAAAIVEAIGEHRKRLAFDWAKRAELALWTNVGRSPLDMCAGLYFLLSRPSIRQACATMTRYRAAEVITRAIRRFRAHLHSRGTRKRDAQKIVDTIDAACVPAELPKGVTDRDSSRSLDAHSKIPAAARKNRINILNGGAKFRERRRRCDAYDNEWIRLFSHELGVSRVDTNSKRCFKVAGQKEE